MSSETDTVVKTTAATIRYLAGWFDTGPGLPDLLETARLVETTDENDICCPVCQEVVCDEHCPLATVRARWQRGEGEQR